MNYPIRRGGIIHLPFLTFDNFKFWNHAFTTILKDRRLLGHFNGAPAPTVQIDPATGFPTTESQALVEDWEIDAALLNNIMATTTVGLESHLRPEGFDVNETPNNNYLAIKAVIGPNRM